MAPVLVGIALIATTGCVAEFTRLRVHDPAEVEVRAEGGDVLVPKGRAYALYELEYEDHHRTVVRAKDGTLPEGGWWVYRIVGEDGFTPNAKGRYRYPSSGVVRLPVGLLYTAWYSCWSATGGPDRCVSHRFRPVRLQTPVENVTEVRIGRTSRAAPWLIGVGGVVAVLGGAVLFSPASDEERREQGAISKEQSNWVGLGMLLGGSAAFGGGIALELSIEDFKLSPAEWKAMD